MHMWKGFLTNRCIPVGNTCPGKALGRVEFPAENPEHPHGLVPWSFGLLWDMAWEALMEGEDNINSKNSEHRFLIEMIKKGVGCGACTSKFA
jgi:hypothetical protein